MNSYSETIEGLKKELEIHVANLKSATEWTDFLRLYKALRTIEELAHAPKTSVEELLGITPANVPHTPGRDAQRKSDLARDDQVETEAAAEIEKGS